MASSLHAFQVSPSPMTLPPCPSTLYKEKGKGQPCTGTEALYRPYGP